MSFEPTLTVERHESNLIITDSQSVASALQQALSRLGETGPDDRVVSFQEMMEAIETYARTTRRVLIAFGDDTSRGLAAIRMVRETTSVPLFAVGPRDAGLILDAVHAGADSFIEDFDPLDEYLARALSRPMNNGKTAAEGKVICVSSVRGGCGGSVISANLAMAFVQRLKRAALCDFDFQSGVCDALLNLKPKHSIFDLAGCAAGLDRSSVESAMTRHSTGLHLLSAPSKSYDGQFLLGDLCQRVIRTMKQMYPVIVVDMPRFAGQFDAEGLISACNKFVLVTQMEFNAIRSTRRALDHLARIGVSAQRIQIVGNRDGQPNLLSLAHAEEALNCRIAHVIPDDPKTVNRSVNCGAPFCTHAAGSPLMKKLDLLVDSLLGDLGPIPSSTISKSSAPIMRTTRFIEFLHQLRQWTTIWRTDNEASF